MTNEEAWEAYKKKTPVRIGERWKHGGRVGIIEKVESDASIHAWFGVRIEDSFLRYYGHQQLHFVEDTQ